METAVVYYSHDVIINYLKHTFEPGSESTVILSWLGWTLTLESMRSFLVKIETVVNRLI